MEGRNQEKTFGRKTDKVRISGLDEAIDDFKHGRVYAVGDIDDYFKRLGVECTNYYMDKGCAASTLTT